MYARNIEAESREALAETPTVLLKGPRQTEKSTLVTQLAETIGAAYTT